MIKKLLWLSFLGNDLCRMQLLTLMQGFVFDQPKWIMVVFYSFSFFNSS